MQAFPVQYLLKHKFYTHLQRICEVLIHVLIINVQIHLQGSVCSHVYLSLVVRTFRFLSVDFLNYSMDHRGVSICLQWNSPWSIVEYLSTVTLLLTPLLLLSACDPSTMEQRSPCLALPCSPSLWKWPLEPRALSPSTFKFHTGGEWDRTEKYFLCKQLTCTIWVPKIALCGAQWVKSKVLSPLEWGNTLYHIKFIPDICSIYQHSKNICLSVRTSWPLQLCED